MKRGDTPTVEQWAKLKRDGWTVETWNAEMDSRARENAQNRQTMGLATAIGAAVCVAAPPMAVVIAPAVALGWLFSRGRDEV